MISWKMMASGSLLAAMGFWGGFSAQADTVISTVGPVPIVPMGKLIVYSATVPSLAEAGAEFDWEENRNLHTNYTIYRKDGSVFRQVHNSFGPDDENAKTVALPPGKYTVRALSQRDGWVRVPVVIKPDRLTSVKLADSIDSPHQNIPAGQAVRAPDGHVVGWHVSNK